MPSAPWWVRLSKGWKQVGVPDLPVNIRTPKNRWLTFGGGGGAPLFVRNNKNDAWIQISTQGSPTGVIHGHMREFWTDTPFPNKRVEYLHNGKFYYTRTDINGYFRLTGVPLGMTYMSAYRVYYSDKYSGYVLTTRDDPVALWDIWLEQGRKTITYTTSNAYMNNRFIGATGWDAAKTSVIEVDGPNAGQLGTSFQGRPNDTLNARTISSTGWVGDSESSHNRYVEESVGWYSLPIGMFKEIEDFNNLVDQVNANGANVEHWAQNQRLEKIEVTAYLSGYSVEKSQKPWMNSYGSNFTTIGALEGVGQLLYQGMAPADYPVEMFQHQRNWLEASGAVGTYSYPVKVPRDKLFAKEDGEVWWAGRLNNLGTADESHGHPQGPGDIAVTHEIDPYGITYESNMLFHMQTGPLPPPTAISKNPEVDHTYHNAMSCWWRVKFIYRYW